VRSYSARLEVASSQVLHGPFTFIQTAKRKKLSVIIDRAVRLQNCRNPLPARILHSASATETDAIGARLAAELRPGDLVLVRGEIGSGKTTLIRGACRALG